MNNEQIQEFRRVLLRMERLLEKTELGLYTWHMLADKAMKDLKKYLDLYFAGKGGLDVEVS